MTDMQAENEHTGVELKKGYTHYYPNRGYTVFKNRWEENAE